MCEVNYSQSLRQILDSECDVSDDDDAWAYDSSCDKYEVSNGDTMQTASMPRAGDQ